MKWLGGCMIRSLQCVHNLGAQIEARNIIFACPMGPLHRRLSVSEISPSTLSFVKIRSEENLLKVSCGPCDEAVIGPFGYHPGAFLVFHPQWFCLVGRCGLVNCLSSD